MDRKVLHFQLLQQPVRVANLLVLKVVDNDGDGGSLVSTYYVS